MAHYEDFDGAYFTIQDLRLQHSEVSDYLQIVIVDNSPGTIHSEMLQGLVNASSSDKHPIKYVPMVSPVGTSPSRNRVFQEADGDAVLVCDCHVIFPHGAIADLIKYYDDNPDCKDILTGPLVLDTLRTVTTHYNDEWRAEMWGTWGAAYSCPCGTLKFSAVLKDERTKYIALRMGQAVVTSCSSCEWEIPVFPWANHEGALIKAGAKVLGINRHDPPFEIPGHGLGVFTCKKNAWLGFNEHARQFGGEELYIHEKFRMHGHKALCLPFLPWVHRFGRANGVRYPLSRWGKVRNYVLEFNELGKSLDDIHTEFVVPGLIKQESWDALIANPIALTEEPCTTCGGKQPDQEIDYSSVDSVYSYVRNIPRDLNEHMETLRKYADMCTRVTEFSNRHESAVALLAARPLKAVIYNTETHATLDAVIKLLGDESNVKYYTSYSGVTDIEDTDFLFLDTKHTYEQLTSELLRFSKRVKRFIAIHDTQIYSESGEDGGPGLLTAIRKFLKDNQQWSIILHNANQYGLTIIGCDKQDKPKLPGIVEMAGNLASSLKSHVADGLTSATMEIMEERLNICNTCESRVNDRCAACGCFVAAKASMRTGLCPLGHWEAQ